MLIKKLDAKILLFMKYRNIIMIFTRVKSGQSGAVSCQLSAVSLTDFVTSCLWKT
jgi:hypothetical protein